MRTTTMVASSFRVWLALATALAAVVVLAAGEHTTIGVSASGAVGQAGVAFARKSFIIADAGSSGTRLHVYVLKRGVPRKVGTCTANRVDKTTGPPVQTFLDSVFVRGAADQGKVQTLVNALYEKCIESFVADTVVAGKPWKNGFKWSGNGKKLGKSQLIKSLLSRCPGQEYACVVKWLLNTRVMLTATAGARLVQISTGKMDDMWRMFQVADKNFAFSAAGCSGNNCLRGERRAPGKLVAYTLEGRTEGFYGITAAFNNVPTARRAIQKRRAVFIEIGGASSQVVVPMRKRQKRRRRSHKKRRRRHVISWRPLVRTLLAPITTYRRYRFAEVSGPFQLAMPVGSPNPGRVYSKSFLGNGANSLLARAVSLSVGMYKGTTPCLPAKSAIQYRGGRLSWNVTFPGAPKSKYNIKIMSDLVREKALMQFVKKGGLLRGTGNPGQCANVMTSLYAGSDINKPSRPWAPQFAAVSRQIEKHACSGRCATSRKRVLVVLNVKGLYLMTRKKFYASNAVHPSCAFNGKPWNIDQLQRCLQLMGSMPYNVPLLKKKGYGYASVSTAEGIKKILSLLGLDSNRNFQFLPVDVDWADGAKFVYASIINDPANRRYLSKYAKMSWKVGSGPADHEDAPFIEPRAEPASVEVVQPRRHRRRRNNATGGRRLSRAVFGRRWSRTFRGGRNKKPGYSVRTVMAILQGKS